jgi:hypothetical protein
LGIYGVRKGVKRNVEFFVYLAGVMLLGMSYPWLDASLRPSWLVFVVVIAWLLLLRGLGLFLKKRLVRDSTNH